MREKHCQLEEFINRTLITQKVKIVGLSFIVHPSDFKSNESFFKKDSPDQKSGFRFAERNAKSFLRCRIRFGFTERNKL